MALAHETGPVIRPTWSRAIVGGGLIVAGVLWMMLRLEVFDLSAGLVLPFVLVGLGIVTMVAAVDGHHPGLIALGIVISIVALIGAMLPLGGINGGIGARRFAIAAMSDLSEPYRLAIGEMRIDLSDLEVAGVATLEADVGLGQLVVIVPPSMAVEVIADSQIGEVKVFGSTTSGVGVEREETIGIEPTIRLDLSTVIGSVEVRR